MTNDSWIVVGTVLSLILASMLWSLVVPPGVLHVEYTYEKELRFEGETFTVDVPSSYIQLPTYRQGTNVRLGMFSGPDPVAEQIADRLVPYMDGLDDVGKVKLVASFVYRNVNYSPEWPIDHWKLPWETVRDSGGDCEDMACLTRSICTYLGVDTMVAVGWGHVVVALEDPVEGWRYIDPTLGGIELHRFEPYLLVKDSFNIWMVAETVLLALTLISITRLFIRDD